MYRGNTNFDAKNPPFMEIAPPYVCRGGGIFWKKYSKQGISSQNLLDRQKIFEKIRDPSSWNCSSQWWVNCRWMNEIVITAFYPQQFELLEAIVKRIVARRGKHKRKKRRQPQNRADYSQSAWAIFMRNPEIRNPASNSGKLFRRRFRVPFTVWATLPDMHRNWVRRKRGWCVWKGRSSTPIKAVGVFENFVKGYLRRWIDSCKRRDSPRIFPRVLQKVCCYVLQAVLSVPQRLWRKWRKYQASTRDWGFPGALDLSIVSTFHGTGLLRACSMCAKGKKHTLLWRGNAQWIATWRCGQ